MKEDALIAAGNYRGAAEFARTNVDVEDRYDIDNLLWHLEGAHASLFAKEHNVSIESFDEAEALIKHYREQILASDVSQAVRANFLNDTTRPYIGTEYDGIMLNTYKAIDYMAMGDMEAARVEFNRAIDRQRRAKAYFAQMIAKERAELEKKEQQKHASGSDMHLTETLQNPDIKVRLEQGYPGLYAFEPYPDFINPMTTYLAGVFAMADDNPGKAETLLKEAYGMMPENVMVAADLQAVSSQLQSGKKDKESLVWVLFENGQAPILMEWRIDLPVFIATNKLDYISIALPRLVERQQAFSSLSLVTTGAERYQTAYLSSMERVIKTEFEKNYDAILRRAIFSMMTKTAMVYAANENSRNNNNNEIGALISLLATIYQVASTHADTRIWSTLPKEFQLARFVRPDDGRLQLMTPGGLLLSQIELPDSDYILVYVKMATNGADPSVSVIPIGGRLR